MACNTITGILKGCEPNNSGGIYAVYIVDTSNVTTFSADTSAHTVTALSATPKFQTFEFNRNTGSMVVSDQVDLVNTSTFFQTTLTLVFSRMSASKSKALTILGEGQRFLDVIVKDANNVYWYVDHAQITASEDSTGTAKADGSKYTVTLVADMDNRPYEVSEALVNANKV